MYVIVLPLICNVGLCACKLSRSVGIDTYIYIYICVPNTVKTEFWSVVKELLYKTNCI